MPKGIYAPTKKKKTTEKKSFEIEEIKEDASSDEEIKDTIPAKIDINRLEPNPDQPREFFDPVKIKELGKSIRKSGLHQPIIVQRKFNKNGKLTGKYTIIAGERRYRAILNEYKTKTNYTVDCRVIPDNSSTEETTTISIQENLQREDLSSYEIYSCLSKWKEESGFTASQIAVKIGKSATFVKEHLRFQWLPKDIVKDLKINPKIFTFIELRKIADANNPNKLPRKLEVRKKAKKSKPKVDKSGKMKFKIPIEIVCSAKNEAHARRIAKMIMNGTTDPRLIGNKTKVQIKNPKQK